MNTTPTNYQLKGLLARKVQKKLEKINANNNVIQSTLTQIMFGLVAQKYPEITEGTKTFQELQEAIANTSDIIQRIVLSMSQTYQAYKEEGGKAKPDKTKLKILDEQLSAFYGKLFSFDKDLQEEATQKSLEAEPKARQLGEENDKLEEEILLECQSQVGYDIDTMSTQEMDEVLAQIEKANTWGFDFFTKRLENSKEAVKKAK
jgi:hypothetical protein